MPNPVPPPEPLSIVQPLPPEVRPTWASTTAHSSATQSLTAKTLPAPTPPELNAAKSAALLGPSVSVCYSFKRFEITNSSDGSAINAPTAQSATQCPSVSSVVIIKQLLAAQESPQIRGDVPTAVQPTQTRQQTQSLKQSAPAPIPPRLKRTPQPQSQPPGQSTSPSTAPVRERIIELTSQRQEYDQQRQIVTAEGNVLLRFGGAVVTANRLQINLPNLIAVGQGNVVVTRGQQVIRGERFTYNFTQDSGELLNARGDVNLPTTSSDFSSTLPTDVTSGGSLSLPPNERLLINQPLQQVTSPGGIGISIGAGRRASNLPQLPRGGTIKRVRFQAERINFYPGGWQAINARITNDPFSPPELELRADTATLTRETPLLQRLVTTRPRLVFDQGLALPIPQNEATIGRRQRQVNATPVQIGYDASDKGGVFIERSFTVLNTNQLNLSLTPQFFVQRAAQGSSDVSSIFGLRARLNGDLGPRTTFRGLAIFNGFSQDNLENRLRASLRLRQTIGSRIPHTLTLEYTYRDRLYNGSLGFQTVQSSIGGILTSPIIPLGKTGFNLNYQVGAQYVDADTDRLRLLARVRDNNRISVGRFQGSATLSRGYLLWHGTGLPSTPTQGLKYTSAPLVPNLVAYGSLQGVVGYYTSGDSQDSLTATVGLSGQFGHFSRPYLDYTSFNISYSQGLVSGQSPFLFDRYVDTKVLAVGFTQQIYGPVRVGFQTYFNLDTGRQISTDYILEYSRRTYGIVLRYNPSQRLGSINFRISDFDWTGGTASFSGPEFQPVVNGVPQLND